MNEERKIEIEEVSEAPPSPPRARVEDAARPRDYLAGFLAQAPAADKAGEPGGDLYEAVIAALKEIYDPEIPVNIYDLGLIYGVDISDAGHAMVSMTLTTPNCPVAESMPGEVELRVGSVPGVGSAEVALVWDPPWDPQRCRTRPSSNWGCCEQQDAPLVPSEVEGRCATCLDFARHERNGRPMMATAVRTRPAALILTPTAEARIAALMAQAPADAIGVRLSTPGAAARGWPIRSITSPPPIRWTRRSSPPAAISTSMADRSSI